MTGGGADRDRGTNVSGLICLQGGAEFSAACRDLDIEVVARTPIGPAMVLAAAAAPGDEYDVASRNAVRYYRGLGIDDVAATPDPRKDTEGCVGLLEKAQLIILPGGSPSRLLSAVAGPVADVLRARHQEGVTLTGASAGAMILCDWTILPDRDREVVPGLALVPGLAIPHFRGEIPWSLDLPPGTPRWGLPECGGVFVHNGQVEAGGAGTPTLFIDDEQHEIPRGETMPLP